MNTPSTERFKKSLTVKIAATALAFSASLAGANAVADQHGYQQKQDRHINATIRSNHRDVIRLNLRVRDHGPENLALGRMIRRHSNIDLDHYRLKAVVTRNGRFSNGYASLRTGNHRTGRYFLGSRQQTRIPAPSGAADTWRLRLGPGTDVKSVTVVLEPRRHGLARNHYRRASGWSYTRKYPGQVHLKRSRVELARTKAELDRTREKLARIKAKNKRPNAQANGNEQSKERNTGKRKSRDTDNERNRRYVISDGKRSNRDKHS